MKGREALNQAADAMYVAVPDPGPSAVVDWCNRIGLAPHEFVMWNEATAEVFLNQARKEGHALGGFTQNVLCSGFVMGYIYAVQNLPTVEIPDAP